MCKAKKQTHQSGMQTELQLSEEALPIGDLVPAEITGGMAPGWVLLTLVNISNESFGLKANMETSRCIYIRYVRYIDINRSLASFLKLKYI